MSVSFSLSNFSLLYDILQECESCISIDRCFSLWEQYIPIVDNQDSLSLNILTFNIRSFECRWNEVVLMISSYRPDIVILLETGNIQSSRYQSIFPNFQLFYQKGKNKNGGVLVLVHTSLKVSRFACPIPNVCY